MINYKFYKIIMIFQSFFCLIFILFSHQINNNNFIQDKKKRYLIAGSVGVNLF